jgi:hypothetical protein
MLKPSQLLGLFIMSLFQWWNFPTKHHTDALRVETELGLFRRTTLLPLKWPFLGWSDGESCVCMYLFALWSRHSGGRRLWVTCSAMCEETGKLRPSPWQGGEKDACFSNIDKKAGAGGAISGHVVGSRDCRCCLWNLDVCFLGPVREKEDCQSPKRTALLSSGWMKKMFQCCGRIWMIGHGGQNASYKIPLT